jgi:hypothetical protein
MHVHAWSERFGCDRRIVLLSTTPSCFERMARNRRLEWMVCRNNRSDVSEEDMRQIQWEFL